ncbi:hypothetical protein H0H92_011064 [Tricholoma furcatifolium]|nr:hypothetical protein H0H92_011064 [Tricholoma furcatifolium]
MDVVRPHPRRDKTGFNSWSWSTGGWTGALSLAEYFAGTDVESLAERLDVAESRYIQNTYEQSMDYQLFASNLVSHERISSNPISAARFKFLAGYRLLDIYDRVVNERPPAPAPAGKLNLPIPATQKLPLRTLNDLGRFITAVEKTLAKRLHQHKSPPTPSISAKSHLLELVNRIRQTKLNRDMAWMLINIQSAAVHIAAMFQSNVNLIDASVKRLARDSTQDEQKQIADFLQSGDQATQFSLESISNSLAIALTTSPLLLLADREYAHIPGKCKLLEYWDRLATCERPPAVEQAELEMWRYLFDVARGQDPMTHLPSLLDRLSELVREGYHPWYRLTNDGRALQGAQAPPIATSSIALIGESPLPPFDHDSDIEILGSILPPDGWDPVLEPKRSPPPSPNIGRIRLLDHSSLSTTPPPTASVIAMADDASVPPPRSPHSSHQLRDSSSPENSPFSGTSALSVIISPMDDNASIPATVQPSHRVPQVRNSHVVPTACTGKEHLLASINRVQEGAAEADQPTVVTPAVPDKDMDAAKLPAGPSTSENPGTPPLSRSNPVGPQDDCLDLVQFTSTITVPSEGPTFSGMDVDHADEQMVSESLTTHNNVELQPGGEAAKEYFLEPAAIPGPAADPAGSDMDISGGEDFDLDKDKAENEFESELGVARKDSAARDKQKDSVGGRRQKESSEGETEKESSEEESESVLGDGQPNKNLPTKSGAPGPPAPKPLREESEEESSEEESERPNKDVPKNSGAPRPPAPKPPRRSSRERKPSRGQVPDVTQQASGGFRKRKRKRKSDEEPEEMKIPVLEDTCDEADPPLDVDDDCPIIEGYPIQIPMTGKPGAKFEFTPTFQLQDDLNLFLKVHRAAMASPDEKSMVHVMHYAQFLQTSPRKIAEIFNDKACIVLVDCPVSEFESDAHMMSSIAPLNRQVRLQDFMFSGTERPRSGRPQHLLDHQDRMLSALNLPAVVDEFERFPVFSDQKAWLHAAGHSYCSEKEPYPVPDMRWYLASTGSFHEWHVDANGLATFVFPMSGPKLWYIGTPKSRNFSDFRRVDLFTNGYDNYSANLDLWDVEVMVLTPGTGLIMRPQLPHLVYTPKNGLTVCKGGHFYFSSMLKDSIIGIYHHGISGLMITNSEHTETCHACLSRLLVAIKASIMVKSSVVSVSYDALVPDVTTWEGIVHVFFLCIYFELCGALQQWSWGQKKLASVIKDRIRSRELVRHICSKTTFRYPGNASTGTRAVREVFGRLLAQHAFLLIKMKAAALLHDHQGETNHTLRGFEADVLSCLRGGIRYGLDCFNDLRKKSCAYDSFEPNLVFLGEVSVQPNTRSVGMEIIGNVLLVTEPAFPSPFLDDTQGAVSGDEDLASRLGIPVPKPASYLAPPESPSQDTDAEDEEMEADDRDESDPESLHGSRQAPPRRQKKKRRRI